MVDGEHPARRPARVGLEEASVSRVPWCELGSLIYWMERCSPLKCRDRHYRHSWGWHASAAVGFTGGILMRRLRPIAPPGDEGASLLLVARVPDRRLGDSVAR